MKKIFSILVALTAVFSLSAKTLYLNPTWSNDTWNKDGARFAIYTITDEKWVSMTEDGTTGIFKADIDDAIKKVAFCRMDGSKAENIWDNKWNQTQDMDIDAEKDQCNITGWNNAGVWAKHGAPVEPTKGFYATGDETFVVNAGKEKSKAWSSDAIKCDGDTLELSLKAADYVMKITVDGTWNTVKGFSDLSEVAKGVYGGDQNNICFTLKADGKLQIIYFVKENKTTFKLVGAFDESKAVELEDGYYLNGTHADWNLGKLKDYKFVKNADNTEAEEYKLEITLVKGQKIKPCEIKGNVATKWFPAEAGDFEITEEKYMGKKIVYFRPEKNNDWTICDGHVYIADGGEGGGETPDPKFDGKFYITGNEALVVAAGLEKAKAWDPQAIACTDSAYTFKALAVGDYEMKLTVDGKWETAKGFSDLAARPKGVTAGQDNNIKFSIAEAGDVKVKFDGAKITLEGKFDETKEITLADGYYLISDPWTLEGIKAAEKFEANGDTQGEYKLDVTLTVDRAIKVVEVKDNAIAKWYPEGSGTEYKVDAEHAGAKTIYFRPAGNEEWKAFGGFIYIEGGTTPTPDPGDQAIDNTAVEMKVIKTFENGQLVIIKNGVKYNANGAKL